VPAGAHNPRHDQKGFIAQVGAGFIPAWNLVCPKDDPHRQIARNGKEIKMKRIISVLLVLTLITTMASCIAVGSGGKKVENKTTLGQQLIDLQKARDKGAISKQEYAELREKLKKSYD